MIAHLSGILQTIPKLGGKDEDLHRKLDTILQNQQNQAELEKKVDTLADDVKKVACEVRNSKEMLKIIDTVETSVGYAELFVKDFERIQSNIQNMNAGFSNAIEETKRLTQQEFSRLGGQIQKLEANIQNFVAKEKSVTDLVTKMEKFQQNLDQVKDALENKNLSNAKETNKEEYRATPERTERQAILSPFSFIQNADSNIVNIVHNTILSNLRVVAKHQMIFEALNEEQRNAYWTWKMEVVRQVPEEVLRCIPEPDNGYVLYYVKHDKLNKALSICTQYSAEAAQILQKWANKMKLSGSEEWMDVVFDSAAKTLSKWTQKMEEQKLSSNPSNRIASMGNNVKESEKVEQRTTDHSSSRMSSREDGTSFTNESQPRQKDSPRAHDIDKDDINEGKDEIHKDTPVRPVRKNRNAQYTVNEEESAALKKNTDRDAPESSRKETCSGCCKDYKHDKGHTSKQSETQSFKQLESDSNASRSGLLVTTMPPPSILGMKSYGNQIQLSNIPKEFISQFGMANPQPGTTFEMTTTYKILSPFSFVQNADEAIVNIVHNTIRANLRAVLKHQVIFEALNEEERDTYWLSSNSKLSSNPSNRIASMGNNVKESEKVEQRTTDHSSSRMSSREDGTSFTNESQQRQKDSPRAHDIDKDDINEDKDN